jgi:hypothetical protein
LSDTCCTHFPQPRWDPVGKPSGTLNESHAITRRQGQRQKPGDQFSIGLSRERAKFIDPLQLSQVFKSHSFAILHVLYQAYGIHLELICEISQHTIAFLIESTQQSGSVCTSDALLNHLFSFPKGQYEYPPGTGPINVCPLFTSLLIVAREERRSRFLPTRLHASALNTPGDSCQLTRVVIHLVHGAGCRRSSLSSFGCVLAFHTWCEGMQKLTHWKGFL